MIEHDKLSDRNEGKHTDDIKWNDQAANKKHEDSDNRDEEADADESDVR